MNNMIYNPRAEFFNETYLHPLAAVMLILLGLGMLFSQRRNALIPMIMMACLVSQAQRIAIVTLNFDLLRVMVLIGWARILLRQEWRGFRFCKMDGWFILWVAYGFFTTLMLNGSLESLKNRLGFSYEALGMYFLFRVLIRTWDDVHQLAFGFAMVAIPVSLAFLFEHFTSRNLFALFGGVPEETMVRDGRLRCQGAFSHPILAGCFWAGVMPLMAMQWWRDGQARWRGVAGLVAAAVIIAMCASSTPVTAVAAGMLGAGMFLIRRYLSLVRWGTVMLLLMLHLMMQAPVWHLVSRMDLAGGSTGWHRFHLIDAFINHFSEWWLIGRAEYMADWGPGLYDVTNYYIMQGLEGGILLLAIFIALLTSAFASIGRMTRSAGTLAQAYFAWALGLCMMIHCVNFLAVTYFGQSVMLWYLSVAMVASMSIAQPPIVRRRIARIRTPQVARHLSTEYILNRASGVYAPLPSEGAAS